MHTPQIPGHLYGPAAVHIAFWYGDHYLGEVRGHPTDVPAAQRKLRAHLEMLSYGDATHSERGRLLRLMKYDRAVIYCGNVAIDVDTWRNQQQTPVAYGPKLLAALAPGDWIVLGNPLTYEDIEGTFEVAKVVSPSQIEIVFSPSPTCDPVHRTINTLKCVIAAFAHRAEADAVSNELKASLRDMHAAMVKQRADRLSFVQAITDPSLSRQNG